jgi:hypothetical protein
MISRRQFLVFLGSLPLLAACSPDFPGCSAVSRDAIEKLSSYAKAHYIPLPKLPEKADVSRIIVGAKPLLAKLGTHANLQDADIHAAIAEQTQADANAGAFVEESGAMVTRTDMLLMLLASGTATGKEVALLC